jgi:hypothetical protein
MTHAIPMIRAELLRLRKNRALFWSTLVLLVGAATIAQVAMVVLHASSPSTHGPAGGEHNLIGATENLLEIFAILIAAVVGATAGASDVSSGVFRTLVTTGRSRWALCLVRVPAAILFMLPFLAAAFAICVAASYAFAGGLPTADLGTVAHLGAYLLASTGLILLPAIGLASATGSTGPAIGGILVFELAFSQLAVGLTFLGGMRQALPSVAIGQLSVKGGGIVATTVTTALIVVALWYIVPVVLGAWRTATRDA